MRKKTELSEKHWQALALVEAGTPLKGVADACGWNYDYFRDLYYGDEKAGAAGQLFAAEVAKIQKKADKEITSLRVENVRKSHRLMSVILSDLIERAEPGSSQEAVKPLSDDEKKLACQIMTALNAKGQGAQINNLTYNYTKGLTDVELVHELSKLKSLARDIVDRVGVSGSAAGTEGILSVPSLRGSEGE